jgi:hypothetical protein
MLLFLLSRSLWTAWKTYCCLIFLKNFIVGYWLAIVEVNVLEALTDLQALKTSTFGLT